MNRYEFVAAQGLQWLALVCGVVVLLARRRRAPRAVGWVLPFVLSLTLLQGIVVAAAAVRWVPPDWLNLVRSWLDRTVFPAAFVVLPVVAMSGRNGGRDDDR